MQDNTKRIAKNTVFLYIRMFVMMMIGLYTSRVILNVLGVKDYGVYNVVGGVVSMFSLLTGSVSSAIGRFITFELGRKDINRLNVVFSTSVNVQILMGIMLLFIMEFLGIWFINTKLNIPQERLYAANWVLQFSIVSFLIGILTVPFTSTIVAHEDINVFSGIGVFETCMKLFIVFLIYLSPIDKLISYSFLLLAVTIIVFLFYLFFSLKKYNECRYRVVYDAKLTREMFSFTGWSFLGDGSWVLGTSGVNLLMNIYFGVVLNAARGIATQVDGIVQQFVRNIISAMSPQITKSYASGDFEYMHKLIFAGAKFSFFIMMFFVIPICLETEQVLHLWLGDIVPAYSVSFLRLTLLTTMCITLGNTLIVAVSSSGKIRNYQLVVGVVALLCFPLTWLFFLGGCSPVSAYFVSFCIYFTLIFIRIYLAKDIIKMSAIVYLKKVVLRSFLTFIVASIFPVLICQIQDDGIFRLCGIVMLSTLCSLVSIYFIGMTKFERQEVMKLINKRLPFKR